MQSIRICASHILPAVLADAKASFKAFARLVHFLEAIVLKTDLGLIGVTDQAMVLRPALFSHTSMRIKYLHIFAIALLQVSLTLTNHLGTISSISSGSFLIACHLRSDILFYSICFSFWPKLCILSGIHTIVPFYLTICLACILTL